MSITERTHKLTITLSCFHPNLCHHAKSAGFVFWDSFPIDFRVAPCEKPPGVDPITIGVNMGNGRYRVRGQSKVNPMWYEVDTAACKQFLFNNG